MVVQSSGDRLTEISEPDEAGLLLTKAPCRLTGARERSVKPNPGSGVHVTERCRAFHLLGLRGHSRPLYCRVAQVTREDRVIASRGRGEQFRLRDRPRR